MKALFVLCTALIVLQILELSNNGVSAENETQGKQVSRKIVSRTETTVDGESAPRLATRALEKKKPVKRAPAAEEEADEQDKSAGADANESDRPTNPTDAVRKLGRTAVTEIKDRTTDLVNGATESVKSVGRKASALGNAAGRQRKNCEELTVGGIGLASGAADGAARGAKHLMNSASEIAQENGNAAYGALRAATGLSRSSSRFFGSAVQTPVSIAGDIVGMGSNAIGVPRRLSKNVSDKVNKYVFWVNDDNKEDGGGGDDDAAEPEAEAPKPKKKRPSTSA